MKLSVAAIKALGFVYKDNKGIDYSKYGSIKLSGELIFEYTYVLKNVSNIIINTLMFDYLEHLGYVESTKCEGSIIQVILNQKYFDDLENKQEI